MTKLIKHNHEFDNDVRNNIKFQEEEAFTHLAPSNKGEMMKLVYTKEELRHIDAGLPIELWKGKTSEEFDTAIHVMNYNEPYRLGRLENMEDIARKRKIKWIGL